MNELIIVLFIIVFSWLIYFSFRTRLTAQGDFVPALDNEYTLGTLEKRWKSLHVGEGTIFITDSVTGEEVALTVADGVFFLDGILQAQLPKVIVNELYFGASGPQLVPYIVPEANVFTTNFNTITPPPDPLNIIESQSGSYTMITPTICFFRVKVQFKAGVNKGNVIQYKIDLPFDSVSDFRLANGILHYTPPSSPQNWALYHIAGFVETTSPKTLKLFYFATTTDLAWKSTTPVINNFPEYCDFDISGTYEIDTA
jgi:hypothetical protein